MQHNLGGWVGEEENLREKKKNQQQTRDTKKILENNEFLISPPAGYTFSHPPPLTLVAESHFLGDGEEGTQGQKR